MRGAGALRAASRRRSARYETLSGGQRARLEILCLELEGHNLLLLDEPTDNLDIDVRRGARGARWTASRARSSPSPTTAPSCERSTASCCSATTARVAPLPDPDAALEALGA